MAEKFTSVENLILENLSEISKKIDKSSERIGGVEKAIVRIESDLDRKTNESDMQIFVRKELEKHMKECTSKTEIAKVKKQLEEVKNTSKERVFSIKPDTRKWLWKVIFVVGAFASGVSIRKLLEILESAGFL